MTRISRGNYFVENVFAVIARVGSSLLGSSFIDERDFGVRNHALILIDHQPSHHSVVGLSEQRLGANADPQHRGPAVHVSFLEIDDMSAPVGYLDRRRQHNSGQLVPAVSG